MKFIRLCAAFSLFVFCSCTSVKNIQKNTDDVDLDRYSKEIVSAIKGMTVREKIGQMFCVVPENFDFNLSQKQIDMDTVPSSCMVSAEMKKNFKQYPVGGIIYFRKNLESPEQIKKMMNDFDSVSKVPLIHSTDEEGGRVARVARVEKFETKKTGPALKVKDPEKMGNEIGTYLKKYGFNVDFAPVADVWTNPKNAVIGDRAFSTDPEEAGEKVAKAISGFHDAGVKVAIKHFPGHGDTKADSHNGTAKSYKTWKKMKKCEMIPFKRGIESGADMVMVAHIKTPFASRDGLPASLSSTWITERLRGELGFDGVVITDAMGMKALSSSYTSLESSLMAIEAGVDILLMPHDFTKTFDELVSAVESGKISESRIDESVARILKMKSGFKKNN